MGGPVRIGRGSVPPRPVWYEELDLLDRARAHVMRVPVVATLMRKDLTLERELRLVPAHALVELGSARHAIVWRTTLDYVCDRVLDPDETSAVRAAVRGTSIIELVAGFACDNAHARVIDLVLRWLDAELILG